MLDKHGISGTVHDNETFGASKSKLEVMVQPGVSIGNAGLSVYLRPHEFPGMRELLCFWRRVYASLIIANAAPV